MPRVPSQFKGVTAVRVCKMWNTRYAGAEAFTGVCQGYRHGAIYNRLFYAHRVAWAIYRGAWPSDQIDHKNGVRSDNRMSNLRDVAQFVNQRNAKMRVDNTSGHVGVVWNGQCRKWQARIQVKGKRKHLGYFDDITGAVNARKAAEAGRGFTERHGL